MYRIARSESPERERQTSHAAQLRLDGGTLFIDVVP
jgi:hypothetical protein